MMRIDSHNGIRGTLYADFGQGEQPVPAVIWFDAETGEYEAFRVTGQFSPFHLGNRREIVREAGKPVRYTGKALKLRFQENAQEGRIATALLVERAEPVQRREGVRIPYDPRKRCEGYACDRHAAWGVTEERSEEPEEVGGVKYERAAILKVRYWCDWCYQPPLIKDDRGEVMKVYDEIGARPQ